MLTVEEKIKNGQTITDPDVGRYFALRDALQQSLKVITKEEKKNGKEWAAWWAKEGAGFKVPE